MDFPPVTAGWYAGVIGGSQWLFRGLSPHESPRKFGWGAVPSPSTEDVTFRGAPPGPPMTPRVLVDNFKDRERRYLFALKMSRKKRRRKFKLPIVALLSSLFIFRTNSVVITSLRFKQQNDEDRPSSCFVLLFKGICYLAPSKGFNNHRHHAFVCVIVERWANYW